MSEELKFSSGCRVSCVIAYGIVCISVLVILYNIQKIFHYPGKPAEDTKERAGKNVTDPLVRCFVFAGSGKSISSSPFSVKISSYLRLTGIPHTIAEADVMKAPKGKVPYITHNGEMIGDSQLIIRYLENTFDVGRMSSNAAEIFGTQPFVQYSELSPTDQAICEMIRLTCEGQLYWGLVSIRWLGASGVSGLESNWHNTVKSYFEKIPSLIRPLFTAMIRVDLYNASKAFGLSRHSKNDQCYLLYRAVDSLSTILGDKQYFLGDFPTECDCIAFGTLQGLCDDTLWPNPISDYIRRSCPNLMNYNKRMREKLFGDFQEGKFFPNGVTEGVVVFRTTKVE